MQCKNYGSQFKIYGLTQNTEETNEYLMVFQFANKGNLHKFLKSDFRELKWKSKLSQLVNISKDIKTIHYAGYIHADFHSGNILQNQHSENIQSYVADLGLSRKEVEYKLEDEIYGVMPYVAPEVLLKKQPFTQAADIYSFSIIMYEVISELPPYH